MKSFMHIVTSVHVYCMHVLIHVCVSFLVKKCNQRGSNTCTQVTICGCIVIVCDVYV